jgi:hypothetical protein
MEIIKAIILVLALSLSYLTLITDLQDVADANRLQRFDKDFNFKAAIVSCVLWGIFYYL